MGVVLGRCFDMQYFLSFLVFCHLAGDEGVGCFTFVVFLVSCRCIVLCQGRNYVYAIRYFHTHLDPKYGNILSQF